MVQISNYFAGKVYATSCMALHDRSVSLCQIVFSSVSLLDDPFQAQSEGYHQKVVRGHLLHLLLGSSVYG